MQIATKWEWDECAGGQERKDLTLRSLCLTSALPAQNIWEQKVQFVARNSPSQSFPVEVTTCQAQQSLLEPGSTAMMRQSCKAAEQQQLQVLVSCLSLQGIRATAADNLCILWCPIPYSCMELSILDVIPTCSALHHFDLLSCRWWLARCRDFQSAEQDPSCNACDQHLLRSSNLKDVQSPTGSLLYLPHLQGKFLSFIPWEW